MIVGFKIFIDLFDVVCTLVVYITYITWAIGICLIYIPSPLGLRPLGLGIYIRQIPLAHVISYAYKLLVHSNNVSLLCRYAFVDAYATYWANLTTPCVSQSKSYKFNYI